MWKIITVGLILMMYDVSLMAQRKSVEEMLADAQWSQGKIMLVNGAVVEGSVKYNPSIGVLSYKDETTGASVTYTAITASSFEISDAYLQRLRTYYSMVFEDTQTGVDRQAFFELMIQLKGFAVLSLTESLEMKEKTLPRGNYNVYIEFAEQDETIFFADDKGNFLPYMRVTNRSDRKKQRSHVIDYTLPARYTQPYSDQVRQFALKRNLSFEKKEDLVLILEHYKTLSE